MDPSDIGLRNLTYALFVEMGRGPTVEEVARTARRTTAEVEKGWRRLHDQHVLVLDPSKTQLRMANPFSAVPTAYRVLALDRCWYANCAWDAIGICAALHVDGRIQTACPDCGDPIAVDVRDERADREGEVFHCLVPAAYWWDDIAFT